MRMGWRAIGKAMRRLAGIGPRGAGQFVPVLVMLVARGDRRRVVAVVMRLGDRLAETRRQRARIDEPERRVGAAMRPGELHLDAGPIVERRGVDD